MYNSVGTLESNSYRLTVYLKILHYSFTGVNSSLYLIGALCFNAWFMHFEQDYIVISNNGSYNLYICMYTLYRLILQI